MQFIDRYKDIVRYTKKVLFTSFVITAMVDCVFLLLSFYVYLAFNGLKQKTISPQFTIFTFFLLFCCACSYVLISKRQKLLSGLARFLEYIIYNNILKIGVIINHRSQSLVPSKRLMADVAIARNIFYNNIIISLMEIPFVICLLLLIYHCSTTNGLLCVIYISSLILAMMIKRTINTDKQKSAIKNELFENKSFLGEDLFGNIFNNHRYIHSNIDIDKISQYYSNIDEARYESFLQSNDETITYPAIIKIITLLFQTILVLNSIYLFIHNHIQLCGFILSIGFIYQFLQKTSWLFQMSSPALHVIKAMCRITKTIKMFFNKPLNKDKDFNEDIQQENYNEIQAVEDEFLDKNYHRHAQQYKNKNEIIIDNLQIDNNISFSYHFKEGNIYILHSDKWQYTESIFTAILNSDGNNKNNIVISIKNNTYKDIFYCPILPVALYGKPVDIITNFDDNVNKTKLDNIMETLHLKEDFTSIHMSLNSIINGNNLYKIDNVILKKLNIASALYSDANILLLEEPLILLDTNTKDSLMSFLNGLKQLGKIIIISTGNTTIANEIKNFNYIRVQI